MSRETDSPSSGPNGHGGPAYPSGTPPYGTPLTSGGAGAAPAGSEPEERKTETTLTTRIRINIPGSRPIPPVVVRKPVADSSDGAGGSGQDAQEPASAAAPAAAPAPAPAAPAAPAEEKTSDWFAPRKPSAPKGGPGGGGTNGAGLPGGSAAPGTRPGTGAGTGQGTGAQAPAAPGAPGAPRPGGQNGALPGAHGTGPVAPGHGGGTGSFDVSGALGAAAGTGAAYPPVDADEQHREGSPYLPGSGRGPAGPTGGPVTGDSPVKPAGGNGPVAPAGGPGGGLSDDTAILTPQRPAPVPGPGAPGAPGYGGPRENVSGHTLTSGIPVVPPAQNSPFGTGAPTEGPIPHTPPKQPGPAAQNAPAAPAPKKKKGRSKLVLLAVGVVGVAGVAYGAGLLMNRSDVPKGTTVLGVDIGGGTRDEAVKKLDDTLGKRTDQPLLLTVDGKSVQLKPDQAGLQLDSQATVRAAAGSDYNPVSVVGSLFGQQRVVEPVMPVDEEKLKAALERAAGASGSAGEGTIKFEPGKAVPVYGKTGKGLDTAGSTQAIEEAYRTQVETGKSGRVKLPTTTRQPTVSKAEVDRMMKEFAEPAMSAQVTVQTDALHSVAFSPENSLWKFLGVKAVDGKLVENYDLDALQELYGATFDGVTITRGNGKKTAVTPQDVVGALRTALKGTTPADRVGVIETDPS
ncbi:hypothetical protein [Streptomyces minutiscleroticus]|uniref:Peptidoglycan binding domain-containing protein n=1 Tax=Streptomyces minutiscleroticus TaxID=68238 RepID=A0A918NC68_9ACTN|nr:hypothetical protein [Streptomyces minutiscleroticus]GGX57012.1 hypothetical protein GCM10010358_08860 [Streptomyces minutiscleroticus]